MTEVQDRATLHPNTELAYTTTTGEEPVRRVTEEVEPEAPKVIRKPQVKRHAPRTRAEHGPVNAVRVDPEVWSTALRLAGGDASRIVDRKADSVVVANHPQRSRMARADKAPAKVAVAVKRKKPRLFNVGEVFTCDVCGKEFSNELGNNRPAQARGLHRLKAHGGLRACGR